MNVNLLDNQAYIDAGDGPAVIFLHGLFGKVDMWESSVDALMKKYRVVVPQLPILEVRAESTNIRNLSEVLHEFIEYHNLRDVHLVGHAIGGQVALMYANDHPHNVDRIVLTGSAGLFYGAEGASDALDDETYTGILNNLDHRVMLLWGSQDNVTPPEVALHFQDFLWNSEVRFIEKCGHLPMVEEPEIFSKHLLSFFD